MTAAQNRSKKQSTPIDQQRPQNRIAVSQFGWAYSEGRAGDSFPRGIYYGTDLMGPLPYVLERIIQRGATGQALALHYRMSMSATGQGADVVLVHSDDVRTGLWAQKLSVPLSSDTKVVSAAYTAIDAIALHAPERELTPRYHAGALELPPPDVAPAGYGQCAGTEDQARADWAELIGLAAAAPKLALALGAGIGGLYIRALRHQSFWFVLSGSGGQGKTTATIAGAAMFGSPELGAVVKSWNTTVIGVCQELGQYGMLPAFRDEWGTASGTLKRELEPLIFQVAEGGNRGRGTRDGIPVVSAAWHGVMFTSANTSFLGQVSTEGASRRIIEVQSPITRDRVSAERVKELAYASYGWPLRWLRDELDVDGFARMIRRAEDEIGLPDDGVGSTIARSLALCVAGAERLERLVGADVGLRASTLAVARAQLDEQMREIREIGATAPDRLAAAVVEDFAAGPGRYPSRDHYARAQTLPDAAPLRDVSGWLLVDDEYPGELAVLPGALRRIAQAVGMDNPNMALRDLEKDGRLLRAGHAGKKAADSRRTHKLRVSGNWRPDVYVFNFGDELPGTGEPAEDQAPEQTELPADDELLCYGQHGAVYRAPASMGECRACGAASVHTWDQHGTVCVMCALGQGQAQAQAVPADPAVTPDQPEPARPARPARKTAQGAARLRLAGVLDRDGLWLPGADEPTPADMPSDAGAAYQLAAAHELRQLWIHPSAHDALGIPASRALSADVTASTAIEHPWTSVAGYRLDTGHGAGLAAWVNIAPTEGDGRRLALVFPAYDYNRTDWHTSSNGGALLDAVTRFGAVLGEPFYMSLNETTAALVRRTAGEKLTLPWKVRDDVPEPAGKVKHLGDWSRALTDEEDLSGGWLHRYDLNGAECSVNTSVFVGVGEPERGPLAAFDRAAMKSRAGYVLANVPRQHAALDPRLPDILAPWSAVDQRADTTGGPAWAPVELLVLLDELGVPIETREALLWPESARLLRSYGEKVSRARMALITGDDERDQLALAAVKAGYKSRIGDFNRAGSRIYRPDIRDAIIAKARANAYRSLRKIVRTSGRYPVAFHVDAAYYVSDESDILVAAPAGMTFSDELGKWKPEDTLLLAKVREYLGEKSFAAKFDRILKGE